MRPSVAHGQPLLNGAIDGGGTGWATFGLVTRALYTLMTAVVVMLALPVSQLRTIAEKVACCCPDPSHCHCPDHKAAPTDHDSMRACHKTAELFASPTVPEFTPPVITMAIAPAPIASAIAHLLPDPHEPPSLARPRGPS
jgi:hypothetical protein